MGNFLLAEPTISDRVMDAFYASHETADGPASNLFLRQPKEVLQTPNVSGTMTYHFDLGTPSTYSYDFLALLFTNGTDAAQITWTGSSSSTFSSTEWTTGAIDLVVPGQDNYDRRHHFHLLTVSETARYVKMEITDAANPDGYFRAGRLYVAPAYRPTVNIKYGATIGFDDPAPTILTLNGERIVRVTEPVPILNFTLQGWGDSAQAEFYSNVHELMRKVGGSKDVVAILNPDHATLAGAMTYYGTLQNRSQIELPNYQLYEASFELRGLI